MRIINDYYICDIIIPCAPLEESESVSDWASHQVVLKKGIFDIVSDHAQVSYEFLLIFVFALDR